MVLSSCFNTWSALQIKLIVKVCLENIFMYPVFHYRSFIVHKYNLLSNVTPKRVHLYRSKPYTSEPGNAHLISSGREDWCQMWVGEKLDDAEQIKENKIGVVYSTHVNDKRSTQNCSRKFEEKIFPGWAIVNSSSFSDTRLNLRLILAVRISFRWTPDPKRYVGIVLTLITYCWNVPQMIWTYAS